MDGTPQTGSYDDAKLRSIYKRLIDKVLPLISAPAGRELSNEAIEEYMLRLRLSLASQIYRTALFFKHPAYAAEKEYRLVQSSRVSAAPRRAE